MIPAAQTRIVGAGGGGKIPLVAVDVEAKLPALWQERPIARRLQSEDDCGNDESASVSRSEISPSRASPTPTSVGSKSGARTPLMKALRKLAPKLGVSVAWLETGEQSPAEQLARLVLDHAGQPLPATAVKLARRVLEAEHTHDQDVP